MVTYVIIYAAMNLGAFAVIIAAARKTRSGEISSFGGLFEYAPGLTVMMTIFLFALAGIPPLAGWYAKFVVFRSVIDAGTPAAVVLVEAHRALEALCLPREVLHFKPVIEQQVAQVIYNGLWFSPFKRALDAFVAETQRFVTGEVRVKLYRGTATVVGRRSPVSLYRHELATYSPDDRFDHNAAVGFIQLWGLPTRVHAAVHGAERQGAGGAGPAVHGAAGPGAAVEPGRAGGKPGEAVGSGGPGVPQPAEVAGS